MYVYIHKHITIATGTNCPIYTQPLINMHAHTHSISTAQVGGTLLQRKCKTIRVRWENNQENRTDRTERKASG